MASARPDLSLDEDKRGWPPDLPDTAILERLLAPNLERATVRTAGERSSGALSAG